MFLVPFHHIEGNYEETEKTRLETDRGNRDQLFSAFMELSSYWLRNRERGFR